MGYVAEIINNATGEMRKHREEAPADHLAEFMWQDGNYSCDCNRAIFWAKVGGEPVPDTTCGASAFSVPRLVDDSGQVIEIDD